LHEKLHAENKFASFTSIMLNYVEVTRPHGTSNNIFYILVFFRDNNKKKIITSPSARRKSHHTALSNAAACNSQCPSTVVSIDDNGTVHVLHLSVNIGMIWGSSGSNATAPVTPREPIFTKREEDLSG